jgi:hypothetical protein
VTRNHNLELLNALRSPACGNIAGDLVLAQTIAPHEFYDPGLVLEEPLDDTRPVARPLLALPPQVHKAGQLELGHTFNLRLRFRLAAGHFLIVNVYRFLQHLAGAERVALPVGHRRQFGGPHAAAIIVSAEFHFPNLSLQFVGSHASHIERD